MARKIPLKTWGLPVIREWLGQPTSVPCQRYSLQLWEKQTPGLKRLRAPLDCRPTHVGTMLQGDNWQIQQSGWTGNAI